MEVQKALAQKIHQFEELNEQFIAYSQQTKMIIDELQLENQSLRTKSQQLSTDLNAIQKKRKDRVDVLEKENDLLKLENKSIKEQNQRLQRELVDLENNNEGFENELRAVNCLLEEYESKVEKTMEELACLRFELEECKETNQEQMTRLQAQIRETEQELNVVKMKHQKHHDESGLRMSQFSWASLSTSKRFRGNKNNYTADESFFPNQLKMPKQDLSTKQNGGFEQTMALMNCLLVDLDKKCLRLKYNSKKNIL